MTKRKPDSPDVLSENIIHELYREPTEAEDAAIKATQKADKAARDEICEALSYDPQIAYLNLDGLIALRAKDKARIAELEAQLREARRAIKDAAQFIDNGIEFGFIRMPDPDTPDAAHNTREHLRAALAAAPEKRDV